MQVLLITQEFPPHVLGGVGYHAYNLARALVAQGHEVHVLTGASDQHVRDDSPPSLPNVEISTVSYRRSVAPRVWFARKAVRWLQSFDRLDEFDLVHAHEYIHFNAIPFGGPTVQKIHFNLTEKPTYLSPPSVPTPLDDLVFGLADATIWRAERRLERRAIRTADVAIANSRLTRRLCYDRHALADSDIRVIYNGVDAERFTPGPGPRHASELLFVGGDEERKGFSAVVDALRCLDHDAGLTVTVAGAVDGVDTARLEATLPIEFVGQVSHEHLEALYRRAAGLVHPARYEPFGNVVLESLACGTPVVVSGPSHCGAAELIDEDTGRIVDPDDAVGLAEAMQSIATRPGHFASAHCRALAQQHTWDRVAAETIKLATAIR